MKIIYTVIGKKVFIERLLHIHTHKDIYLKMFLNKQFVFNLNNVIM